MKQARAGFAASVRDVRYGLRMVRKNPGFSAVAIASLAVGIGVSTVLFSAANAFLFRPLPGANPSELVQVFTGGFEGPSLGSSSWADYDDFRHRGTVFGGLMAFARARAALNDHEGTGLIAGSLVSANYFEVLGLHPSRGRFFHQDENRTPGTHPVVVLSHDTWLRRFGSDPAIVGRVIALNGHAFTVIGVAPPRFAGTSFDYAAEFFVPAMMQPAMSPDGDVLRNRRARVFTVLGRPASGVTVREADAALRVIAAQLFLEYPDAWRDRNGNSRAVTVLPEVEARVAKATPGATAWIITMVLAGVVVLLGIACVNVATVLLARAATRRKEIAVRLAVGASRGQLVRQLLTECAIFAAAGGTLGILMAQWVAALFARFRPDAAPAFDLTLDYRVVAFGIGASLLTILLCGLAPALQATRPDIDAELKGRLRSVRVRRLRFGLRDALVVVQVAVSLALIVGAALMFRSLRAGINEDPGFRRAGVLSVELDLSTIPGGATAQARFFREAVETTARVPSVEQVALAALVPMDGSNRTTRVSIDRDGSVADAALDVNVVGPGYFSLLDIPVVRGREFAAIDRENASRVALVNETMARQFWQGDAVGRTFRQGDPATVVLIVGVVRDLRHRSFAEPPLPMIYFCAGQQYSPRMTLHVRTGAPAPAIGEALQQALHGIHPAAGLGRPSTMADHMEVVTLPQRIGSSAAAATGLVELGLAVMALYGVIAFTTTQRTREIGLRMALGASRGSVVRLIMRDGLMLAGTGIGLGVAAALAAGPILGSLVIGIGAADPVSFGVAATLLLLVAAIASYVPARRAMRIDPSVALRCE